MKQIILASQSPQRKKLLRLLGIPFRVVPSRVAEIKSHRISCTKLVQANALRKARDVLKKIKDGIIIGADTLVYLGKGKVMGKPRHLREAKRTLKILSRQPHWIYTGLAVIDASTKKTLVGIEKTKLWMHPLSDKEISAYYRLVSPFDKAGGFDIEGRASVFVRRIEGCYFNVVGLPLAKLSRMLKKMGIPLFAASFICFLSGCMTEYNLATQQEETIFFGTEKEIKIGEAISQTLEKEVKFVTETDVNERVSNILQKLVSVCDRKELRYSIRIIDEDKVNAVSLPGGFIYVYRGLLDNVADDDQLACVIAHEVGHVTAKHGIKRLQSLYGYGFLKLLAVGATRRSDVAQSLDLAFASIFTEYSKEDEFMADKLGIKYAKKAGFNPEGMAGFLKKLGELQAKEGPQQFSYWRTHPYIPQRIAAANQEVTGSLEFKDYLNLVGEE